MFNSYTFYSQNTTNYKSHAASGNSTVFIKEPVSFLIPVAPSSITDALQLSLEERIEKSIFVLSADCGTGKSIAVSKKLAKCKAKGSYGKGVIIFVNSFDEVDTYVLAAGLEKEDYAIQTGAEPYAGYGSGRHKASEVPVLFASHAKARRVFKEVGSFGLAECFYYRGKPRALRVWDEALPPVETASFALADVMALPSQYKALPHDHRHTLFWLAVEMQRASAGAAIEIPAELQEIADAVLKVGFKASDTAKQTLHALAKLSGSKAYLQGSVGSDTSLIGTGKPLPVDIAPLIVLDASARLTGRYDDWSPYGMVVRPLPPIAVSYCNLTVHCWNRGAGKTQMRKPEERNTVFRAIADLINGAAGERFLIVMAKEFCGLDDDRAVLPNSLADMIDDLSRVAITNWGRHVGINSFRDIPNVIIVGDYSYDETAYDALALGVSGNTKGIISRVERSAQKDAEFISNLYQAVCRSSVRNVSGAECGRANAYLIMAEGDHRRSLIERAFPDCSMKAWEPVPQAKQRKADKILALVVSMIEDRALAMTLPFVSFSEVIKASEAKSRSYLTKIVGSSRFKSKLAEQQITIRGRQFVRCSSGAFTA
ncbi:hypothetical protein [Sphingomonas sp. TZW2008]|uniref:hypothetical protein n=1 Tax=Sphingomonas sp. TZW2008 TaxID=1917973 RepID=UPI0011819AA7|nr:hypothetical protein [Sphingomonas sp. TZW2008]